MNKYIILSLLFTFTALLSTQAQAQEVDSSFTYQGELQEDGAPANGLYDFQFTLKEAASGQPFGNPSVHLDTQVVNGLFQVSVDFDINAFDGFGDVFFDIEVRPSAVGGPYTMMGSQTIQAVPLATNLTNGDAMTGEVLTFNGFQWVPQAPATGTGSPWTLSGSNISFTSGRVGIGTASPSAALDVETTSALTATFNGGNNMFVGFAENGSNRGYIGSFVTGTGVNDEDFEIGTYLSNSTGGLQFTTQNDPKMTITNAGKVGIGNTQPPADLTVDGTGDTDILRVRINSSSKLLVDSNGGTSLGAFITPPADGLRVEGDVKQSGSSNGMMKYMVNANCSSANSSIIRSYNGISNSAISISGGSSAGECLIDFPTNINTRYWQVSASGIGERGANCTLGASSDVLRCTRFNTTTGVETAGSIMVLVY